MRKAIVVLLLLLPFLPVPAAGREDEAGKDDRMKPEWNVDFSTLFDNREGDSRITDTRTFLQARLAPEGGVSFDGGRHTVMAGVAWTQPLGTEWKEGRLDPTLYYRYNGRNGVSGMLGMFPRTLLARRMPNYIWSDSAYYWQANVRGAAAAYRDSRGWAEGVLDWRGMQTETRREAFNIILRGEYAPDGKIWRAGGLAMMNHFALTRHSGPDEHIVDNFVVNPYIGADLSRRLPLDSLEVRAGMLMSVTRNRADSRWRTPTGFWMEATLRWKRLGVDHSFYAGGKFYPYYSDFGALLDQGEPYYRESWYERASVSLALVRSRNVDLRAAVDFNIGPHNFTFYQRLLLGVTFGSRQRNPARLLP